MLRELIGRVTQTVKAMQVWGACLELDGPSRSGRRYRYGRL